MLAQTAKSVERSGLVHAGDMTLADVRFAQAAVHGACLRMVSERLVVGSAGNVSARIDADHIVVSAGGVLYEHLAASDHPVVSLNDGSWTGTHAPTSEIALHLRLMRDDPSVNGVVHTHSKYACAFSIARVDLPFVCNENIGPRSERILVTDYEAPGTVDLGDQAAQTFAKQPESRAILLANHGVVAVGESVEQAFTIASQVEWIAEVTHLASTLDPSLRNVVVLPIESQDLIGRNYGFSVARPVAQP
jgi:L-fuculose-phosphate aldolase